MRKMVLVLSVLFSLLFVCDVFGFDRVVIRERHFYWGRPVPAVRMATAPVHVEIPKPAPEQKTYKIEKKSDDFILILRRWFVLPRLWIFSF